MRPRSSFERRAERGPGAEAATAPVIPAITVNFPVRLLLRAEAATAPVIPATTVNLPVRLLLRVDVRLSIS